MLATMRPAQHYPSNSVEHSRATSRNSSDISRSASPSKKPEATMTRSISNRSNGGQSDSNAPTSRPTRKAPPSSLSHQIEAIDQPKPGLITLSKPYNRKTAPQEGDSDDKGKASRRPNRKKKMGGGQVGDKANSLSMSAPAAQSAGSDWEAQGSTEDGSLTWQQQMLSNAQPSTTIEKKKKAAKKATTAASPSKDSLTWQQELLGSNKPRGATFDVFADARDEQTFGATAGRPVVTLKESKKGERGRKRADSAGAMRLQSGSKIAAGPPSAPLTSTTYAGEGPSTPNSKFAYAGPNFHNSPSPASLPVPKFLQKSDVPRSPSLLSREAILRNATDRSGQEGDTSTSSEDWEEDVKSRSARGTTAPPELQTTPDAHVTRSVTIESLLAKMMRSE